MKIRVEEANLRQNRQRAGESASPAADAADRHFRAARDERDGPSPLPDDVRCPHGTDQGGTVEVLPPLTCVRGGFYAL